MITRTECNLHSIPAGAGGAGSARFCGAKINSGKGKPYETNYITRWHRCLKLRHLGACAGGANDVPSGGGESIRDCRRNADTQPRREDGYNPCRATGRSEKRETRHYRAPESPVVRSRRAGNENKRRSHLEG